MSKLTVASYNVQYGTGLDGKVDLDRIVDAVREADIICFQEITLGFAANGAIDMVAAIETRFPDRFCTFHPPCDVNIASHMDSDGKAVSQRMQFGNMVVSRWPFLSVRGHLLPRRMRTGTLNLQRGLLETVITTPLGTHVFASVHLDHINPNERLDQVASLRVLLNAALGDGNGISGVSTYGFEEPAQPTGFLVAGDFNFNPASAEYAAMVGDGIIDVTTDDLDWTYTDPDGQHTDEKLDYMFCDPTMAAMAGKVHVNRDALGSDHMPVFVQIENR